MTTAAKERVGGADEREVMAELGDYLSESHRRFGLQELSRARSLSYFTPLLRELFNAGEAKTRVAFTVLYALMVDERVRWSRPELDEKFHWLREVQRSYLLGRLSNVGWLEYFRDQGLYMISDKGEAMMRVLCRFMHGSALAENEGAALAEIEFSQLLEFPDLNDRLKFLRNRLMKHIIRAETALDSQSPYRILEIYEQLKSAYRWAEQTRTTLDNLEVADEDEEGWNTIRGVHDHLSRLHSLIAAMQLSLQDIQRKQIDIARFGLTHLDFDNFLIHSRPDALAAMMERYLQKAPHPFFTLQDAMFLQAQEVLERERDDGRALRGWETEVSGPERDSGPQGAPELAGLVDDLKALAPEWRGVEALVEDEPWEIAAYRFSLLTLLADRRTDRAAPEHDPLLVTEAQVRFDTDAEMVTVEAPGETRTMTRGEVRRGA